MDAKDLAHAIVDLDRENARDRLLEAIGEARFVALGEATHGTEEMYRERALITQRLLREKSFDAIAIEADWPDAWHIHEHVRYGKRTAEEALAAFTRFPTWMWRNVVVLDLVRWLRAHAPHAGVYGLDLYSMYASIEAVLQYLDDVDPVAARRARARYACFDHYGHDTSAYAHATAFGLAPDCEQEATQELLDLRARSAELVRTSTDDEADRMFYVEQNARLVKNAEEYYRSMFAGSVATWNLRDRHMADTLGAIVEHLDRRLGRPCKVVLWAHNSHLGDARATEMRDLGELDVGQLLRERYGRDAFLVGFTTYDGTVTAAEDWDQPPKKMTVKPALPGSYEAIFHDVARAIGARRFMILPDAEGHLPAPLRKARLERAIGVVYRPQTERTSHWFRAHIAFQFDAIVHLDRTHAVEPLDRSRGWHGADAPETFPFAV